jgi:transposase-like protein
MELEPEKRRRRRFDAEFKHEAARLVLDGGRTQREVARNLGVNPSQIKDWVKKYKAHGKDAFPGNGALRPQDEENRLLKKELARVTEERDILKKALAVFSRGPK